MTKHLNRQRLQQKLEFNPREWQSFAESHEKRFNILDLGRRAGKSHYARYRAFRQLILPHQQIWVVAPNYSLLDEIWNGIYFWSHDFGNGWIDQVDRSSKTIKTKHGSVLECKSADNPASLRGKGNNLLIVEEAAMVPDTVFQAALRPTLSDRLGTLIAISTPRPSGWFKDYFYLGQSEDSENSDYFSLQLPTTANPDIPQSEIDEAKRTLPEAIFRQEYLAEFIDDGGAVFRNIQACATGQFEEPQEGVEYIAGIDLAKHEDFTVIFVARRDTRSIVYHERFNELSWPVQKQRILSAYRKYHFHALIDSTGIGDVVYDDLFRMNIPVEGYKFTSQSKTTLVENLIAALDDHMITFPQIPELISELEAYQFKFTPSRNVQYGAPLGLHDDEVSALMLVNYKMQSPSFYFAAL